MTLGAFTILWLVALVVGLGVLYALAYFKIIFTFCDEGTVIVVTSGGNFKKVLYSIKGWVYDRDADRFVPENRAAGIYKRKRPLEFFLGIHFIGIPFFDRVHTWVFDWNKWAKAENQTEYQIISKRDKVSAMVFQFPYALKFTSVEIQGQIEIDFDLLVTLRSVSPYIALFLTGSKWLEKVSADIEAAIKGYMGGLSVDQVRLMKSGERLLDEFLDLIRNLTHQLLALAGQEVVDVKLLRYKIGGADEIKEAAQSEEVERLKGLGVVAKATAAAQAVKIGADATRYELENTTMVAASNPLAAEIESVKQLPQALTTLVQKGAISIVR